MKEYRILTLAFLVISASVALSANQKEIRELFTLSDYLQEASLNNAELKAAFEEWKAALEQIPQAKALQDPKFTFSYYIQEVETRVGPMDSKLGIMQTFPWFGEIEAKTDVASAKAKAIQQKYEAAKLKLYHEVKKSYLEYTYLSTAIHVAKENLELLEYFEEVARSKYTTASATHPDVIRAQVELAKLEDILESLENLRNPTTAQLNSLLNRDIESSLPWPEKVPFVHVSLNRENIIRLLVQSNPELAELDWKIEAAKSSVKLARTKFYPDIGIGIDWTQVGSARNSGVSDSGKDAVALMFSINIPLWQDSYRAAERQAQAELRRSRYKKTEKENQKIAFAVNILYDIEDSQRKIKLYGETLLSKAEELIQSSETAYKAGTVDFLSLIDAQRMLLKYRLDHERATINYQQKIAELEMLIGKELTLEHRVTDKKSEKTF